MTLIEPPGLVEPESVPWVTHFHIASGSHKGKVRDDNQDSLIVVKTRDYIFAAVCDGMGGAKGGKLASEITVEFIRKALDQVSTADEENLRSIVLNAIREANDEILAYALNNPEFQNMGTTICGVLLCGTSLEIFNVGDSRLYRIRGHQIQQLTQDHTLVCELLRAGLLDINDPQVQALSHILTRSIGPAANLQVDSYRLKDGPVANDIYIICSDGLYNMVSEEEILSTVKSVSLEKAVEELISLANEHGGYDNVSVVLINVLNSFPVKETDLRMESQGLDQRAGYVPAERVEDIYTPIIADYLKKLEDANKPSRSFISLTVAIGVLLGILFISTEYLFFSRSDLPRQEIASSTEISEQALLDSAMRDNRALRLAYLQSRLNSLYAQLEMLKVSNTMDYQEISSNLQKQRAVYQGQLDRNIAELAEAESDLKVWRTRRSRAQLDDLVAVAREMVGYQEIAEKLKAFEEASWQYLNNLNNSQLVERFFQLRKASEDALKNSVMTILDKKIRELERKINFLNLEGNLFRTKLAEISRQEQFFNSLRDQEAEAKRQLEERIASEIFTLEAELRSFK